MSSTVWSVNTEIYPIHLIATGTALATSTNWLSNYIVSSTFLSIMQTDAGKVIAFIILAFFSLIAWLFIYFLLPETNGLSINVNVENVLKGNINNQIKKNEKKVII
jgi:hypothetical protein